MKFLKEFGLIGVIEDFTDDDELEEKEQKQDPEVEEVIVD